MTTPTISSVTGTVQTGQTLTIAGANMVDEDTTDWLTFFKTTNPNASSFEGANPAADGYSEAGGPSGGAYTSAVKLMGSKSMLFHVEGASVNCPDDNKTDYNWLELPGGDANEAWIRFYARWVLNGGGWPESHIKMIDGQGDTPNFQVYFQPRPTNDGSLPTQFDAVYDATSHSCTIPSGQLQNGRWYGIQLHWKTTTGAGQIFKAWIDGTLVHDGVPTENSDMSFLNIGIINCCLTNSAFNLDHWWDGFAVSQVGTVALASKVEIGNNSNYATATKVYQAPTTISDTSNVVTADLTGLGTGDKFLWVTNNRGERSATYTLGVVVARRGSMSLR